MSAELDKIVKMLESGGAELQCAAAMVLARSELAPGAPRYRGGVTRAATQWNSLCRGNLDRMVTDTKMLLIEGMKLAQKTFVAAKAALAGPYPLLSPDERADYIVKLSQAIQARSGEIAETITAEMGSPASWAIMGQVFAPTMALDGWADLARTFPFEEIRPGALGPVLSAEGVVGAETYLSPGDAVRPLRTAADRYGHVIATGPTTVEALDNAERASALVVVEVE